MASGKWPWPRDLENNARTVAVAELDQLGWLVGNWVDESQDALVRTTYRWSETQAVFCSAASSVQVHGRPGDERQPAHRLGSGGAATAVVGLRLGGRLCRRLWAGQGSDWLVKSSGATRDGRINSATNVYHRLGADRYSYKSRDRVIGGQLSEDIETIAVREPPPSDQVSRHASCENLLAIVSRRSIEPKVSAR